MYLFVVYLANQKLILVFLKKKWSEWVIKTSNGIIIIDVKKISYQFNISYRAPENNMLQRMASWKSTSSIGENNNNNSNSNNVNNVNTNKLSARDKPQYVYSNQINQFFYFYLYWLFFINFLEI